MVLLMRPQAESKGLSLNFEVDDAIPTTLYGQKNSLERIFLNLLGNAVKFTKKGKINLVCKAMKAKEDHVMNLRIVVKDTGVGITKGKLDKIFDKFNKLAAPSGKYKGSGLGLYFVKVLTERMDGKVTVKSEPGKGTQFQLDIPLSTKRKLA